MHHHFIQVYDQNVSRVYGFFAYRLGSRADAEDLTQATFERALRAWPGFDESRSSAGTWLLTIARNLLIDHYRRDVPARERPLQAGELESLAAGVEATEGGLGPAPEIASALRRLTGPEREVIALRFGADLSGPEIAKLLGLSLANVHQICSRGLRKLRDSLEPRSPGQTANGPLPRTPPAGSASRVAPSTT